MLLQSGDSSKQGVKIKQSGAPNSAVTGRNPLPYQAWDVNLRKKGAYKPNLFPSKITGKHQRLCGGSQRYKAGRWDTKERVASPPTHNKEQRKNPPEGADATAEPMGGAELDCKYAAK